MMRGIVEVSAHTRAPRGTRRLRGPPRAARQAGRGASRGCSPAPLQSWSATVIRRERTTQAHGSATSIRAVHIDPRTATPCRTVAFSHDGAVMAEANYLGFVTLRDARSGDLLRRFLAQTALVETIRFEEQSGLLLLVGAGFEGGRDGGV